MRHVLGSDFSHGIQFVKGVIYVAVELHFAEKDILDGQLVTALNVNRSSGLGRRTCANEWDFKDFPFC